MTNFPTSDRPANMAGRTMRRKSQPVEIVGIDTDTLDRDDTYPDAYAFYITMSGEPDYLWQSHLAKWDSALESMKRKISVEKNRLRLVFVYGDNVQLYTDYASSLVNWVNERIVEHNSKIDSMEKAALQKEQINRSKEELILQQLKNVKSEPAASPMEMTVTRLAAAFENNSEAYERYRNTSLRIRGFINEIDVTHNYLVLADTFKSRKTILCVFDKGRSHELKKLKTGKMITVMGEFEGSVVQLSMRHCTLVIP